MSKTKIPTKDKIIRAALDLAAERDWGYIALYDIAEAASVSLAELFDHFEDKTDIFTAYIKSVDRRVLEAFANQAGQVGQAGDGMSPRDTLFDVLMERFDVMNEERAALSSIMGHIKCDPAQAVVTMPYLCRSMSWMLEASGFETRGLRGALKLSAVTGLYLKTLRVWLEDDSEDMAKVMAALDKDLGRLESVANTFGF